MTDEELTVEPEAVAVAAGLVYVSDDAPGYDRQVRGQGFSYVAPDGSSASGAERDRLEALAIPPAWTEVWISTDPDAHLLATGRDDEDRKQYRYHERWREVRDAMKFERVAVFGDRLPRLRQEVQGYLNDRGLGRTRVLAAVLRLMDLTLMRVGNEQYVADNETFGATTLLPRHVDLRQDRMVFAYEAKGGLDQEVEAVDPQLQRVVAACLERTSADLFCFEDNGSLVDVTSDQVNEFLQELVGEAFSAKDFRTWGGTAVAAGHLGPLEIADDGLDAAVLAAIDAAAARLGNTRAVARACYVAPQIPSAVPTGQLAEAWRSSRNSKWMTRPERTSHKTLGES